jgi:hypothetical protein
MTSNAKYPTATHRLHYESAGITTGAFNITRLTKYEWPEANIHRLNLAYYKSVDINL